MCTLLELTSDSLQATSSITKKPLQMRRKDAKVITHLNLSQWLALFSCGCTGHLSMELLLQISNNKESLSTLYWLFPLLALQHAV